MKRTLFALPGVVVVGLLVGQLGVVANGAAATVDAVQATKGILITKSEIDVLPTSGRSWETLKNDADHIGVVKAWDQDNRGCANTMAAGLVYLRTGGSSYRSDVRDVLRDLPQGDYNRENGTLALGRNLAQCVIAADLIDLAGFDSSTERTFSRWLSDIRTKSLPKSHVRWTSLTKTCENSANNWGTSACASRLAADLYLGDKAGRDRIWALFQAYTGDRSKYPADGQGENGYFEKTGSWQASYFCGGNGNWVGINPVGCRQGSYNLDGGLGEELSRSEGACCPPGEKGFSYHLTGLRGAVGTAELLDRQGFPAFEAGNQALRRAMAFACRNDLCDPPRRSVNFWLAWVLNYHYQASFPQQPTASGDPGYTLSYGDWLWGANRPRG